MFRSEFGRQMFIRSYRLSHDETWQQRSQLIVRDVCGALPFSKGIKAHPLMSKEELKDLQFFIEKFMFIPGGRYIYYAGRGISFFNNCMLYRAEYDTREEWGRLLHAQSDALMSGAGVGCDYSILRPRGTLLSRTGGVASGPVPLLHTVNEMGRNVRQGGSRRSAIYSSLNWQHGDIDEFLTVKDWRNTPVPGANDLTYFEAKQNDFDAHAPLDGMNISVNYDDEWLKDERRASHPTFIKNVEMAMRNGEPGFSFNFGDKQNETLRNAPICAETMVLTDKGYQPVGELVGRNATVWTGKQWVHNVVFKQTGENVPTVLVTMTGGRTIRCDPTHPFLVDKTLSKSKKHRTIERVNAENLKAGDRIQSVFPEIEKGELNKRAYTLGFLYGDGSFHKSYPRAEASICCHTKRPCIEGIDQSLVTTINEVDARGYMRIFFKNDDLFHNRNKNVFPEEMFTASQDEITSFLAGLFDADGNYTPSTKAVRLSCSNYDFLIGVRRLLEQLGIIGHIANHTVKSGYGGRPCFTMNLSADHVNRFSLLIPCFRIKPESHTAYRSAFIKVVSVTNDKYDDVYCCNVGVDEHSFMAEGVIISNCGEVCSADDSDICNLGSINLANIDSKETLRRVVELGAKFLVCGTLRADVPDDKTLMVREKNRRLGLGLMGIHEWLLKRQYRYEMNNELRENLAIYQSESERAANEHCDRFYISRPVGYRAIAPTGTTSILAGTTSGIEPLYAVAYKRRWIDGEKRKYQFVIDKTAQDLIQQLGITDPDSIETAIDLAKEPSRRIKFQAEVQQYVDHCISSTINLPAWGSEFNNENTIEPMAKIIAHYAPQIRGLTFYPDGARGGQPLTRVNYHEALKEENKTFEEHAEKACKSGVCNM